MEDFDSIAREMREHHQAIWQRGDAWELESSEFEQDRYAYLLGKISDRHYDRVLEIGCGSGCFTRLLAGVAERVVAIDIAPAAIERARVNTVGAGPGTVEFRVANIMEYEAGTEEPWDLIILSETIYSLGWLYPFFNLGYFASQLFAATRDRGRCLLANTLGKEKDWLLRPWLMYTCRDLFRNVGFRLEHEELYRGTKHGVALEVLVSLFEKPG
jgi:SAM-dependent methyltransferase